MLANGPASLDRGALVALFNATCGLTWPNNEGWLTASPVGEWHGVTVNGSGRVVGLDLRENNLRGKMPAELGNLGQLEVLALPEQSNPWRNTGGTRRAKQPDKVCGSQGTA